jgi:5-methylcytosine-specific restriction endonuclease McrA
MGDTIEDSLALGQRIVAILETGARVATYKLATLAALLDHCVENLPADRNDSLQVPIPALAHRVLELYWPQVRPFEGVTLKQSTGSVARILRETAALREVSGASSSAISPATAQLRAPDRFAEAVDEIGLTLAQQPLHRLQRVGTTHDPFLYDDSWLHDGLTKRQLRERGNVIELRPGVAYALARLSGLLKPALEILWVEDVRRLNRLHFGKKEDDLAGHLFGRSRISMAPARRVLKEAFGARCFYCNAALSPDNPVDHVLPWSRVGIDGLANLVLSCQRCNGDKSHALPALELVDKAVSRERELMEQLARAIEWPTQVDRVVAAARGIYRGEPTGALTWSGVKTTTRLDVAYGPDWLLVNCGTGESVSTT